MRISDWSSDVCSSDLIVKIFFQPGVDIATANAQVTAVSQTILKTFPAGTTPPLILNYNASTVPIIQLALSGQGFSEQNLGDLGLNLVRTQLVTVPGAGIPYPFGGKTIGRASCRESVCQYV